MEKRRVTVRIGGQTCSFYSDDSDEYISALTERANAVMKQTALFSGPSAGRNAVLSVVFLTDALMRAEQELAAKAHDPEASAEVTPEIKRPKKNKESAGSKGQVSVWDLLEEK